MSTTTSSTVRAVAEQADRLVELGVPGLAGIGEDAFRALVPDPPVSTERPVLVVHPGLVPSSRLAPLLRLDGKPGFVVVDMTDLDEFVPADDLRVPTEPLYVLDDLDRGDDLRNASPAEARASLADRGRRGLTVSEGISWLLQEPDRLEPNHCFMTIASRRPAPRGRDLARLDARVPAIWISGGTGRDGKERKGAPKVGWCWENNRHTWLGFASCPR